jgi:hypothetical protein
MAARKLAVNVTHGGEAYGPDYPHNKVTPELRKLLADRDVWEDEPDEDEEGARPGPDRIADGKDTLAKAAAEQGKAVKEAEEGEQVDPKAARVGTKVARDQ